MNEDSYDLQIWPCADVQIAGLSIRSFFINCTMPLSKSLTTALICLFVLAVSSCKKEDAASNNQTYSSPDGSGPADLSGQQWVLYQYSLYDMNNPIAINDTLRFLSDSIYTWSNSTYVYEASRFWGRHSGSWLTFRSSPWGQMRMVMPYDVNTQTSVFCYHRDADSTIAYLWFSR